MQLSLDRIDSAIRPVCLEGTAGVGACVNPSLAPHYRPLGALRFGLALLVVLQHFQHLLDEPERVPFHLLGLGAVAVAIFFVVSGFVVTEANSTFYRGRPGAFLANRLLRIVPPYAAALLLSILAHAVLWHAGRLQLWDFTLQTSPLNPGLLIGGLLALIPGFHTRFLAQDFEFIPFVWSLRVEIAFYLAACLTFAAARAAPDRRIAAWALALGLAICAAFLATGRSGLLSTGPMFLTGVGCCLLLQRRDFLRAIFTAACVLLAAAGFSSWDQHGYPILAWQFLLLACLLAGFALLISAKIPARLKAWDRALGDLSYPLYLNHYIIGILLFDNFAARNAALYTVGVVISIGLAWVMGRAVDQPLRYLRDHLRRVAL